MAPLRANFLAFLVASCVSYVGNWFWTFEGTSRHAVSLPRFAALSLSCFALNQAIVYGVVGASRSTLWLAMVPVVVIVPVFGFWLSKTQVFLPRSFRPMMTSDRVFHPATILIAIALLFAGQIVIRLGSELNHDTAWYLYVAQGLRGGGELYRDYVEVNPPLAMWLTVPVVMLSGATGLAPIVTL